MFKRRHNIALYASIVTISLGLTIGTATVLNAPDIEVAEAWSGEQTPDYSSNYYSKAEGLTGESLKSALASFNRPSSPSYNWSRYEEADEAEGTSDSILCLYTRLTMKKSAHVGSSYSLATWNREHVFPQGAFPNSDKDNHNIYACEGLINNYRNNYKFGEVAHNSSTRQVVHGFTTDCYLGGGYFEPCDEAKGEIARSVMYCCIYYGYDITDIFQSEELCLQWHELDPVDSRDIYRNNTVEDMQGNRNPFVDHPEYANAIWGDGTITPSEPFISMEKEISIEENEVININAKVVNGSGTISYQSEDNAIATVDNKGNVKGIKAGMTNITASVIIEGKTYTAKCQVEVRAPIVLTQLIMNKTNATMNINNTLLLNVTPVPNNASKNVVWSSSDESVASVNGDGEVKALKIGNTTISATSVKYPNIKATCEVLVLPEIEGNGFKKVSETQTDWSGEYVIGYEKDDKVYVFDGTKGDKASNYTSYSYADNLIQDNAAKNNQVIIESVGSNQYQVVVESIQKAIASTSPNDLKFVEPGSDDAKMSIRYANNAIEIKSIKTNAILKFNTDPAQSRFRFYKSGQGSIQLFKETVAEYNADAYAVDFVSTVTCDNGVTPPSIDAWNAMKDKFNNLSTSEQDKLKTAVSSDENLLGICVERYDYILLKYGEAKYENFMHRPLISSSPINNSSLNENNIIILTIAVTVSVLSISSIVIISIVKSKRKENN